MFQILDYLAGVFDKAVAGFDGFGVTMAEVGATFDFVGNTFVAIAETAGVFNIFEIAGKSAAGRTWRFLKGLARG
jgi:hypothetical protein